MRKLFAGLLLAFALTSPAAAETVLSFPTWQAEEAGFSTWWKELIAAYENSHPGVRIAMQQIAFPNFSQELTVRFASNTPPDIVELSSNSFGSFAAQGWLEPLDPWLQKDPLPAGWSTLQSLYDWNGKTLGVMVMGYGFMMFYNEALLQQAGVAVPTTLAEFETAVDKLTQKDKGIFGLAAVTAEYPTIVNELQSFIRWQGANAFAGGRYTLTDPKVIAALETYRRVVGGHAPLGNVSTISRQTFTSGKAAFLIDGPWVYALFKNAPENVRPSLKMIAPPFQPHMGGASNSLHIPEGISAERKQLVWEFIRLAMQPQWQRRYFILTSSPPGQPAALTPDELQAAPQLGQVATAANQAESFYPLLPPIQENVNEFIQILTRTAVRVIATSDPVATIAADAQAELSRALPLR